MRQKLKFFNFKKVKNQRILFGQLMVWQTSNLKSFFCSCLSSWAIFGKNLVFNKNFCIAWLNWPRSTWCKFYTLWARRFFDIFHRTFSLFTVSELHVWLRWFSFPSSKKILNHDLTILMEVLPFVPFFNDLLEKK